VKTLYSAGDIPPPRTYTRQDVLIVRGKYREAAEYFRDHLTIEPDDNEARLRLADILEKHLNDPAGSERLYLEVRGANPDRGHEMRAANGLIDLYRKQGRRDRLLVELARFADRYRGTGGADAAARLLRELKAEGTHSES
jgi:tetratricopeptide (TPR) repeat protein